MAWGLEVGENVETVRFVMISLFLNVLIDGPNFLLEYAQQGKGFDNSNYFVNKIEIENNCVFPFVRWPMAIDIEIYKKDIKNQWVNLCKEIRQYKQFEGGSIFPVVFPQYARSVCVQIKNKYWNYQVFIANQVPLKMSIIFLKRHRSFQSKMKNS